MKTVRRLSAMCSHVKSVNVLSTRVDEIFAEPYFMEMRNVKGSRQDGKAPIVVHRLFECDLMFRDLLVREPIISIAENVLG